MFELFCGIFVHLIIDLPRSVVYIIEISAAQPEYNRITFKILQKRYPVAVNNVTKQDTSMSE
jgi:hypothetical protein